VFPLRSRTRKEFELWKQAVGLWQDPAPLRDIAAMEWLRRRLIAQRVYKPAGQSEISTIAMEPDGLTDWLAGFLTGEAHFGIHEGAIRLALNVRADDLPLLRALSLAMGAGTVGGPYVNRGSNPAAKWSVTRTSDLLDLANRLDQRVRGRKAVEFEIWQRAVRIRADTSTPAARRRRLIDAAGAELIELRRYRPGGEPPSAKSRRLQRMYEQNGVWLALLREWAAAESGPLTAMAYQRARHSDWPARNTLTLRFGSWYDALAAAGLKHRAALSPDARDLRLRGGTQARAERRRRQRARVIAAFRRCQQTLGRPPGPSEYARWRLHNDPAAPTFGTAYRHFPGGWSELRAAAVSAA
jgi:hypothetical protein